MNILVLLMIGFPVASCVNASVPIGDTILMVMGLKPVDNRSMNQDDDKTVFHLSYSEIGDLVISTALSASGAFPGGKLLENVLDFFRFGLEKNEASVWDQVQEKVIFYL